MNFLNYLIVFIVLGHANQSNSVSLKAKDDLQEFKGKLSLKMSGHLK